MSDYPALTPDDQMPFGQYEGEPIWQVIQTDHEYITWLIYDAGVDFELDGRAYEIYLAVKGPE